MSAPNGKEMMETLRGHRPLLLACEAIGWLHMAGKANADFLRRHGGQPNQYEYEKWFEFENPPFPWSDLFQWVQDRYKTSLGQNAWPSSLTDFVTKHTGEDHGLLGLLQAGHGIVSGIEKNAPRSTSKYLRQDVTHMWLTSPFGHPVRNLLAEPPQLLANEGWQDLLRKIKKLLEDLQALGNPAPLHTPNDLDGWWHWREGAIGPGAWLREAFLSTLAETRVPNNDVTLWDQSYVAAALFKAAVAGAVLAGPSFHWGDKHLKRQTRWRVLTIGLGSRHYEARAVKIGDWVGARRDIDGFFEKVRRLIEVDLAIGSLIYQDDETLAFTFPGLRFDATEKDSEGSLEKAIETEVEKHAESCKFETPPLTLLPKSKSTRSFIGMVGELREAHATLSVPLHRTWPIPEPGPTGGHVCPVCQVRLNQRHTNDRSDNARKQRVCKVCGDRRKGRLNAWLAGESDTIWISEVADGHDRVAWLTLSLDLEPWLEGRHVDSLRAQAIQEWKKHNLKVMRSIENQVRGWAGQCLQPALERYFAKRLAKPPKGVQTDGVLRQVIPGLEEEFSVDESGSASNELVTFQRIFQRLVEDRSTQADWTNDHSQNAKWFIFQSFRKLPSPGRIYRFWRAAETFFDELLVRFREIASAYPNRWRTRRLVLEPDEITAKNGWEDRETYSGRLGEAPLEVLYQADIGGFITICNLARCLDAQAAERSLEGQSVELKGDDGQKRTLTIRRVPDPDKVGVYAPVIPLDRSPQRFRVLVPLECASACIETAMEKWQGEFGRVWDRMPLRAGIVGFPRMTPFQAVIESARNLEADLTDAKPEVWRVEDRRTKGGVTALTLVRRDRACETVLVPTGLPDGREDVFYPYFKVEDRELRHARDFQHPNGTVYRHAAALHRGDGVFVQPSRVTAVFLDATSRRFEKARSWYLSDFRRMRDTWTLLERVTPSLGALRGAWAELEERQVAWRNADGGWEDGADKEWIELARAVLSNRLGISGAALDHLAEAARNDILEWAIEWHLSWLKEGLED